MKSLVVKNGIVLGLFLMLVIGNAFATEKAKNAVGTWAYEAPTAPYEYAKGKLIFTEKGDKMEGKIKIGEEEIAMRNIKADGENVSFGAYVEGEYVSIKIAIKKNEFSGTANSSEGAIKVTGKKVK